MTPAKFCPGCAKAVCVIRRRVPCQLRERGISESVIREISTIIQTDCKTKQPTPGTSYEYDQPGYPPICR